MDPVNRAKVHMSSITSKVDTNTATGATEALHAPSTHSLLSQMRVEMSAMNRTLVDLKEHMSLLAEKNAMMETAMYSFMSKSREVDIEGSLADVYGSISSPPTTSKGRASTSKGSITYYYLSTPVNTVSKVLTVFILQIFNMIHNNEKRMTEYIKGSSVDILYLNTAVSAFIKTLNKNEMANLQMKSAEISDILSSMCSTKVGDTITFVSQENFKIMSNKCRYAVSVIERIIEFLKQVPSYVDSGTAHLVASLDKVLIGEDGINYSVSNHKPTGWSKSTNAVMVDLKANTRVSVMSSAMDAYLKDPKAVIDLRTHVPSTIT